MAWAVEFSRAAAKTLDKLDRPVRERVLRFFDTRVTEDPRRAGKALVGVSAIRARGAIVWAIGA